MEKYDDRILFLKEFTKELIIKSKPADYKKTQEIFQYKVLLPTIELPAIQKIEETIPSNFKPSISQEPGLYKRKTIEIEEKLGPPKNIIFPDQKKVNIMQKIMPQVPKGSQFIIDEKPVLPQPQALPIGFNLEKLNFLIDDPRVTSIESPGPGKLVIAKIFSKPSATKIVLTQEEIQGVIEKFSKESKIPVISGLFKAAVGNLIITAVISELVGSRFVITKINPAFILGQNPPITPSF